MHCTSSPPYHQESSHSSNDYNYNYDRSAMISPGQSLRRPRLDFDRRGHDDESIASSNMITPPGSGTSTSMIERWMALRMRREMEGYQVYHHSNSNSSSSRSSSSSGHVSPHERAEVSRAVYGILRDNLPPSLAAATSRDDLTQTADAIETKLYHTAPSPRAYATFSTLEFRITALATAVLIHSDTTRANGTIKEGGVSETCARLSAAARRSLVYCVMVLVSFEQKKNGENTDAVGGSSRGRSRRVSSEEPNKGGGCEGEVSGDEFFSSQAKYLCHGTATSAAEVQGTAAAPEAEHHVRLLEKYEKERLLQQCRFPPSA